MGLSEEHPPIVMDCQLNDRAGWVSELHAICLVKIGSIGQYTIMAIAFLNYMDLS